MTFPKQEHVDSSALLLTSQIKSWTTAERWRKAVWS